MSNTSRVIITTSKDYYIVKIPKEQVKGGSGSIKKLTATEALRIFEKNRKAYIDGKLKEVDSLSELI